MTEVRTIEDIALWYYSNGTYNKDYGVYVDGKLIGMEELYYKYLNKITRLDFVHWASSFIRETKYYNYKEGDLYLVNGIECVYMGMLKDKPLWETQDGKLIMHEDTFEVKSLENPKDKKLIKSKGLDENKFIYDSRRDGDCVGTSSSGQLVYKLDNKNNSPLLEGIMYIHLF